MDPKIESYLTGLALKLIDGKWKIFEFSEDWVRSFDTAAGVYAIREEGTICYISETKNVRKSMENLLDTRHHSLRRTIGAVLFSDKEGYQMASPSKKFPPEFEKKLNMRFEDNFEVAAIAVAIGRKELEEHLIAQYQPKYNFREKRKSEKSEKAYSVEEIRQSHGNAYQPWTTEADEQLAQLANEGKSINELALLFGRNRGSITSRLKKIEARK
ncbi:hypothetical protein QWY85_10780 [Neolewinella lacunae]|uniref:GIY-YIG catalytic domain-containing protein n=1 Tax=Neolewinella lacunae TaxID=1517758 RepID=A0A923T7B4_9BACT|nr:hypothetical protein [Neolewinella lacunae]MBC6993399.1 hypothetical protein [Neolewinella lacunae]MDN3635143.1 hypothetical protein [Neolewinella lacunae]